ncbi:MAG: hypothetical protein EOP43_04900 [Sphingobacteriaceae bacterium]|nr:MAG: hypothetical protein EOP43_04900 [Sphingobacteriaceae bacterium]
METINETQLTEKSITAYLNENCLATSENNILNQILTCIKSNNQEQLIWFSLFGGSIRQIVMNVIAHRKSLEFGFTEISFGQYGWLNRPVFLEQENIKFGITKHPNSYSEVHIGRGINNIWTYALSYSFGTAGGGCSLSIYGKHYESRWAALDTALTELKEMMQEKVGDTDTTNYKQPVILATLKAINDYKSKQVQMTLF